MLNNITSSLWYYTQSVSGSLDKFIHHNIKSRFVFAREFGVLALGTTYGSPETIFTTSFHLEISDRGCNGRPEGLGDGSPGGGLGKSPQKL